MERRAKRQDLDDLTQQVFENVLAAQGRGEVIKDMRSYSFRVAHNLLISRYRRDNTSVVTLSPDELEALPPTSQEVWRDVPQQRSSAIQRLRQVLQRVTDELGKQCRDILLLDRGAGFTDEEISKEMGLSVHTVRKRKTQVHSFCEMLKKEEQQR